MVLRGEGEVHETGDGLLIVEFGAGLGDEPVARIQAEGPFVVPVEIHAEAGPQDGVDDEVVL